MCLLEGGVALINPGAANTEMRIIGLSIKLRFVDTVIVCSPFAKQRTLFCIAYKLKSSRRYTTLTASFLVMVRSRQWDSAFITSGRIVLIRLQFVNEKVVTGLKLSISSTSRR